MFVCRGWAEFYGESFNSLVRERRSQTNKVLQRHLDVVQIKRFPFRFVALLRDDAGPGPRTPQAITPGCRSGVRGVRESKSCMWPQHTVLPGASQSWHGVEGRYGVFHFI